MTRREIVVMFKVCERFLRETMAGPVPKDEQQKLCEKYGAQFVPAPCDLKIGISRNVKEGMLPINDLRCPPGSGTSGWFIWAGDEMSQADDFFVPLHVEHVLECCPQVLRFLGLPPGWRFLVAGDFEDVWQDPEL